MRRRLIVPAIALLTFAACGPATVGKSDDRRLATRRVEAGAVDVTVEPQRLDDAGASFRIIFDTHSVDLGFDVARASRLTIDGVAWTAARWTGTAPGGHHREGTLTFSPAGPARGPAILAIGGLPQRVEMSWTLGQSP